jgi:2-polyprenyl-3-methyl-5-hydroxy-6-metoxy-1,4-benzoquinol methylase
MDYKCIQSELGYRSVSPMPSPQVRLDQYKEKYYQADASNYRQEYSAEELRYFNNDGRVTERVMSQHTKAGPGRLLDVGAGEGFFAKHFLDSGWDTTIADDSSAGMGLQNPTLLSSLLQEDLFQTIEQLAKEQEKYDLISLRNVLEHVIDPIKLLSDINSLIASGGILRINVPNDYSKIQHFLLDNEMTAESWFSLPEHLNYEVVLLMAEFPIEMLLANEHSNYCHDRTRGKAAHDARILVDNYLVDQGLHNYIDFYSASAAVNLGRQIVTYVRPKG